MTKKERSEAAKKAWATRRRNQEALARKRRNAAKKAWITRRANS
jgi:hypothetical protein